MLLFWGSIVVRGCTPFSEDTWTKSFSIGSIEFLFALPCARCKMITVNPSLGEWDDDEDDTLRSAMRSFRKGEDLGYVDPPSWKEKTFFGIHIAASKFGGIVKVEDELCVA